MPRPCFIIDAFASERFAGNPAAVVLDADGLDDGDMQRIAAEFNLSETTFVLPAESAIGGSDTALAVRFRWFTPTVEVDMCGHATVAGIHALVETGCVRHDDPDASTKVRIETRSGLLTGSVENIPGASDRRMIWLEMMPPTLTCHEFPVSDFSRALRISPDAFDRSLPFVRTQDRDLIAFVKDFMVLNDVRPDFPRLADCLTAGSARGLCLSTVHTLTPSVNVQSRFFVPNLGINEDPVTGSVHSPLASYLASHGLVPLHDGLAGVTCVQGIPGGRTGLLYALVQTRGDGCCTVRIGGQAVTVVRGSLMI